ncbi:MAG TPA: hypothetical protein VG994_02690 [Steroidobacteraceae bacterium]|nr:hypothetical protein [Steroidobacteraceae bacterium]
MLARIDEMGVSQNQLARDAGISKASLSEALAVGAIQTTVMPQIHKALGWKAPPTTFSPDQFEALALYMDLNDFDRGEMLEKLRQKVEQKKRPGSRR